MRVYATILDNYQKRRSLTELDDQRCDNAERAPITSFGVLHA